MLTPKFISNMLDNQSKKISLTEHFNVLANLISVSVEVTISFPDSSPDIIVLDTLDSLDNSSCVIPNLSL